MKHTDRLPAALCRKAIEKWGFDHQLGILQEECGEVVQAVSHYMRGLKDGKKALCEEVCDLMIVLQQIVYEIQNNLDGTYFPAQDFPTIFEMKTGRLERMLAYDDDEAHDMEEVYDGWS